VVKEGRRERRREYFNWCPVSCNTEGSPLPKWRVRRITIGGEGRGRMERRGREEGTRGKRRGLFTISCKNFKQDRPFFNDFGVKKSKNRTRQSSYCVLNTP
jgi:hypothetical protein